LFSELPLVVSVADEANLSSFKDLVVRFPLIIGNGIDRFKDLDPPAEVEDAHDALIDAGGTLVAAFDEGVDVMDDAETMAEFETIMSQVEITIDGAQAAFDAACLVVKDIARANDIHASISCTDE